MHVWVHDRDEKEIEERLKRIEKKVDALAPTEVEVEKPHLLLTIGPFAEQT